MYKNSIKFFRAIILFILLISSVGSASAKVESRSSSPACPPFDPARAQDRGFLKSLEPECAKAYQKLIQKAYIEAGKSDVSPMAVGGSDAFGYTFDDTVSYSWISAATDSGLVGDDEESGPINIGFDFPFYGFTQTQLYFTTNGLITFGPGYQYYYGGDPIPSTSLPNNFIAPFWEDYVVGDTNSGVIYYEQGGSAPNRYFVVEWRGVETWSGSDPFSVEAVLYENGDIVFQYQSLPTTYTSTVGIENNIADDGLAYQYGSSGLSAPKAIQFYYPTTPTARVSVSPLDAGEFTTPGGISEFTLTIANTGNMGADTYDLTTSSTWPVTLYRSNGTTLLTDTDMDTVIDTGSIPQGTSTNIVAKFTAPGSAQIGDNNAATVTATSSLNSSITRTANLSMSVPAGFANVFLDETDNAMSFLTAHKTGTNTYKATADNYFGYGVAVTKLADTNYLYAWSKSSYNGSNYVDDVEFIILDGNGSIIRSVTKVTNNSSAAMDTYDRYPSIAAAPNGVVGIIWQRYLYNSVTSQYNTNIYFATLDGSGNLLTGPTNITNNSVWGMYDDLNIPGFWEPTIAPTDDNRFILSWNIYQQVGPSSWQNNIWYAVRNTSGASVFTPAALTSDDQNWRPVLNSLTGGKAILTWLTGVGGPFYAVINSDGSIFKTATSLNAGSTYLWSPDAVLLPNGKVGVAWATVEGVQFSILNSSYSVEIGPISASDPNVSANGYDLSVTTDGFNHVIMTWTDGSTNNLVYALADSTGTFITLPMFYKTSANSIQTSSNGQGNASFTTPIITGNAGVGGATLSYIDGTLKTVTADGSGDYSFIVPSGWSGPSHRIRAVIPSRLSTDPTRMCRATKRLKITRHKSVPVVRM